ncbi:MAG: hypothetical protein XU10_C0044G0004 [Chloroflexi bacterium CSP1-4]|nr:MAG: hypothetical protein XU10_C0044G0004 [Chloroflexi bacterium CSP1-4]
MNITRSPDAVVAVWLDDGPHALPHETRDAITAGIRTVTRRQPGIGWPFTRPNLPTIDLRRLSVALGSATVTVVAAALTLNFYADRPGVGGPIATADPPSPFLGTWLTTDDDGSTPTMTMQASGDGSVEIVVRDDFASVCSGAPSTMTGTGQLEGATELVIPSPVLTCDEGSVPQALSGPPLEEQLRNLTFTHDPGTDTLTDNFGSVWAREGADPSPEPTTPFSEAEVTALLNGFLEARIAGEAAQQYLGVPEEDIPLLYATTSGAPYERAEFERVLGIDWPYGLTAFKVRLFAGDTVVEQLLFIGRPDGPPDGLEYRPDGFGTDIAPTTENGQPVAMPYNAFDGEVTLQVAHPWVFYDYRQFGGMTFGRLIPEGPGVRPTTDGGERNDGWDQLFLIADPALGGAGCQRGPSPPDAAALAESIRSNPDLGATAPVAVSVGGAEALMMDVVIAAGTTISAAVNEGGDFCADGLLNPVFHQDVGSTIYVDNGFATGLASGDLMRLYLMDAPEGSSMRILAIAIVAPESRFERVVEAATPVVYSIEFHAP